jgi:hypothetical protein
MHVTVLITGASNASPYIPSSASPSMPGFFSDYDGTTPHFSSHYADVAQHSRFDPNAMFSLTYNERRQPEHGDSDDPFTEHRGPLEFEGDAGADNMFDRMPARGNEEVADEDGEEGGTDEEEEEGEGEEEEEYDEEEDAEGAEEEEGVQAEDSEAADTGKKKKKKKKKKKEGTGSRGPKWKALEDQWLYDSWKIVSINAIIDTNKKYGAYWARIKAEFDERRYIDKDKEYAVMPIKRSQKAISTCWAIILVQVNAFQGYHPELEARG